MRATRTILSALCGALIVLTLIPTFASAIPRDVVIGRGRVWVEKNVPYSQTAYATVSGTVIGANTNGYRTDCSGFISMCWNLRKPDGTPKNLDTAGLDSASLVVPITKDQLQAGDMLLRAKDKVPSGGGHSVLFVKWGDPARTTYWTYEEVGSGRGTITQLRTYANSIADYYEPYRYRGMDPDFADVLERISGLDRYEGAVAAVEMSFPASPTVSASATVPASATVSVPAVIIASGETWPDALGGAALAGAQEGPLLLTARGNLPVSTLSAILRLRPKKVFLLGGTATVSERVESQIASMNIPVTRVGGTDRYEVSKSVARAAIAQARSLGREVDTAYIATGLNFPDALAASPISARTSRPILLTRKDALPAGTLSLLAEAKVRKVIILGGTNSVSKKVASELVAAGIGVSRIDGTDRYAAAINIARHGVDPTVGMSWKSLGLASGSAFADALSGGVAQGQFGTGALLLLTHGDRLTGSVASELRQHRLEIRRARVFGGSSTVQQPARAAAATALRP